MRKALLLGVLGWFLAGAASASSYVRVEAVDGDSVRYRGVLYRVVGLDTPELRARCPEERVLALRARDRMAEIGNGRVRMERVTTQRDKYGRPLVRLYDRQGRDVAAILISEGLARPFDGRGRRGSWCPV